MITAQERFDKLLWQTAFEIVYSDYAIVSRSFWEHSNLSLF